MKIFNLALILRLIPVALFGIGYAPDSRMLMELSDNFDYRHSVAYPMILSILGPAGTVSLQIIADSLTAAMIGSLSSIGGVLYALSLGPIIYSNYVLTDTLATFFLTMCLVSRNQYLFGASLLCAIFLREICLLLSPLFIFLYWYTAHGSTTKQAPSE